MENDNLTEKKVFDFYTVANEYCIFIEQIHSYPKESIVEYLEKVIPLLYIKGALLPDADSDVEEINERYVTEESYELIQFNLSKILSELDEFIYINDENGIQVFYASEQLADIYQDLKDFLLLYNQSLYTKKNAALSLVRQWFRFRWGKACIALMHHIFKSQSPVIAKDSDWE